MLMYVQAGETGRKIIITNKQKKQKEKKTAGRAMRIITNLNC